MDAADAVGQNYQLFDSQLPRDDPYTPWLQRQYCLVYCFNIFSNCFIANDCRGLPVARGSERLAGTSATCLLCAFSRLLVAELVTTIIGDLCQLYKRVFPPHVHLRYPSYPFVVNKIHRRSNEDPDRHVMQLSPTLRPLTCPCAGCDSTFLCALPLPCP